MILWSKFKPLIRFCFTSLFDVSRSIRLSFAMFNAKHIPTISFLYVLSILLVITGCDEGLPTSSVKEGAPTTSKAEALSGGASQTQAAFEAVPGEYVIVFKNNLQKSKVAQRAQSLAQQVNGTIMGNWTTALRGFSVKGITEKAARAIEKKPYVKHVGPNMAGTYSTRESVGSGPGDEWGLDRVNQRSGFDGLYTSAVTGSGVTIYILDSGVRISHNAFGNRASHGYDFIDNDGTAQDCVGHGTHVAGIAAGNWYGIAELADIVAVRVGDCAQPYVNTTIDGIEWVMNNHSGGPAVINLSVQFGKDSALDNAVQNAINAGFTVVAAAGNLSSDACSYSPSGVADAITVGATDVNDARAQFQNGQYSNYGSCVDLFAPGDQILSVHNGSDTDTEVLSGTSMSAPHVAGTAALRLEVAPSATPQQVRDFILQHATQNVVSNAQSANDHLLYSLLNHPKAPENLSVSCIADDSPHVDWDSSPSSDTDYYEVQRSIGPTLGYSTIGTTSSTSYDDTEIVCADGTNGDDEHYYRAITIDTEGLSSAESNYDSAITTDENPYPYSPTISDTLRTVR